MKNYNIDWDKTKEHIAFMIQGRTRKQNLVDILGVEVRQVQRKLSRKSKEVLGIRELLILADYLLCDVLDLLILEGEPYIGPMEGWEEEWRTVEVDNKTSIEVEKTLNIMREIKEAYPIRNMSELLLYLPLIEEEVVRAVVYRCAGNWSFDNKPYLMDQMAYLYRSIPESPEKQEADAYRDNVLRTKGYPKNNMFGWDDEEYFKNYDENLKRYLKEENSGLYDDERKKY